MIGMKVNFTKGLERWLDLLPERFRRVQKRLQGEAQRGVSDGVMPEPRSEGEAAVIAAMGWDAGDWQRAVTQSMNDEL